MSTKRLFKVAVVLATLSSFLLWNLAVAAPEGGTVAQGSAVISQSGSQTNITQTSQNAVINWHGFDTAATESVKFSQPNSSSVALNRITSGLPTTFAGSLTANGQIWILNPAGVLFTSTSKIDVAGLVASTLTIKDSDFMNKNYALSQSPDFGQSSVINNGLITSHENGLVALVAPTVENNGTIVANMGNVLLASGTVATIDPYGDNLINFAPNNYAVEGSVTNTGTISANGGKVVMAANSVNKIIKNVVNSGGFIEAQNAVVGAGGVIILGGSSGTTNITGKILSNRIVVKGHDTVITGELKSPVAGGYIETSGETVDVSRAVLDPGQGGLWYLDPLTIDIATQYGNVIQNQLQNGVYVTLSTGVSLATGGTGIIFLNQPITWNTSAALTLMAYSSIFVTAPITVTNGSGALILHADTGQVGGTVSFSGAGSVNSNGVTIIYYHPPGGYGAPTNFAPFFPTNQPTAFMTINNLTDLQNVGVNPAGNYLLNADITSGVLFSPVFNTTFSGIFDGHDYLTGGTHTISNVSITNPFIQYFGAIADVNTGTIENLVVAGTVFDNTFAQGVGGIAGYNFGTIANTVFNGTIIGLSGSANAGGIAGINNGGTIVGSGSLGAMVANNAGGIVGLDANGIISRDYSQMSITAGNRGGIIGTATGTITFNYVYYAGNSGGMDAFIGNGASTLIGIPGGVFYVYGSDHCTGCTVNYLVGKGIPAAGFPDSSITSAFIMNSLSGFTFNAGPGTWTTQGDTQLPTIIQLNSASNFVLLSGSLSSAAVQTVSLYGGNNFISNFSTNATGDFGFEYNPDAGVYSFYLATTNGATVKGATLKTVPTDVPVTNLNITNNLVKVDGGSGFTNANLAVATSNAPYTVSGNNLTLSSGVSFLTTAITPFTLNGNITTSGAGTIIFNNVVALSTDSVLTSAGLIDFTSTVNGAHNLTANGSNVIFGATVGGTTPLTGLTVISNSPITQIAPINVNGLSSFTAGANPITLMNVGNLFSGAVTLVNSGANDVQIYNNAPLILTTFNLGGNLTASTSGGAITLNGVNTSGGTQTYNAPVLIGSTTSLTSTNGNINFFGTVDGAFSLTLNAPAAAVIFGGTVGGITPLGSLTVNTTGPGGAIQQSAPIIVSGASSFSAGANFINLPNTGNSFGGPVTLSTTGAGFATIYNSTDFILGASTNIGSELNVTVAAGKTITLNGNVTTGTSQDYHGPVLLAADAILSGPTDVIHFYNTVDGAHNLTLNGFVTVFDDAVGSITPLSSLTVNVPTGLVESVPFFVSGVSSFNAVSPIDLSNANNSFGGAITLNGSTNVTLVNSVATVLGASSVGGMLTVTSNGPISQTCALTVGGASSFDAGANAINLSGSNDFVGPVSFSNTGAGNNVTINNTAALILNTSSTDGNLIVTSNGNAISQTGPLTVGGTSSFNAGAGAITLTDLGNDFQGQVTLANTGANDVQIYNNALLNLAPFNIGGSLTVTTDGSDIILQGVNTSGGSQTYNDSIVLGAATTLDSLGGDIIFYSTITGPFSLIIDPPIPALVVFYDSVNIDSLNVTATLIDFNGVTINTTAGQTYMGAVELSANANLTSTSGVIDFGSTINGNGFNLSTSVSPINSTVFNGDVSNVAVLDVTGVANINASSVSTSGDQIYGGPVSLGTSANLSTSGGNIEFDSTVDAAGFDLTTNTTADPSSTIFDGNVSNLNNLTVNGDAIINNAVQITAVGTVTLNDEVSGPGSLVITAANTLMTETDSPGVEPAVVPLSSFTINGPVTFTGAVVDADTQTYNGLVTIAASPNPTVLDGTGLIHFANSVEGPGSLTLVAGTLQFDGGVGDITPLDVLDITAPVTLNGTSTINAATENFRGPVVVNGTSTLNSSGTVHFFGTIDGPGSLTVDAALTQIDGVVGGTTPLSLLDIVNAIILNGANITATQAIFEGPATIGSNGATINSADTEFLSTISGPGGLAINGNLIASDDINIGNLSVTGTTLFNKGSLQSIVTQGSQIYGDTVTLNNDALFRVNTGVLSFGGGGLYGPTYDVTLENFSYSLLNGIIGSVNVNNLTLGGTGGANLTNSFFNSLQFELFSIGSFCVNGSCTAINLNSPEAQRFIVPSYGVCDASGCMNAYIDINYPYLLQAYDPLSDVCVMGADGTVSCVGPSENLQ